jgi:hypothetical protein
MGAPAEQALAGAHGFIFAVEARISLAAVDNTSRSTVASAATNVARSFLIAK